MLCYTENPTVATGMCGCNTDCDCNELFKSVVYTPDSTEAIDDSKQRIKASPIHKAIILWFSLLTAMHLHFCDMKDTCTGIPSLNDINDDDFVPLATNCIYCCESIWALKGIKFGFKPFSSSPPPKTFANYPQTPFSEKIGPDIKHEYKQGWLRLLEFSHWTNPMFVKDESTTQKQKYRIIKDFSGWANDYCECARIAYMTIRAAVVYMVPFCYFFLIDVSQAFRSLPLHPTQSKYLVYSWFGRLFEDMRLPWGLRPSSEIFCRISALIRLILMAQGFFNILVYNDDFFGVDSSLDDAEIAFDTLKSLLVNLGFT